ncbi:hypothetical protein QSU92_04625 [Microbacterium sp. ET2]|uniref:hypothetical protein n=1 Tax=Microbacterium albipurpureum TaxID=3050384 RepID=UPI00259CF452|nr:hypothetical protein [Microbacterium sp. ET2 (Ac-2212)]WJL96470.1 hypothetical protein QSU92_04625 [Microbacterium sp. ET2 (Ac-2212)]
MTHDSHGNDSPADQEEGYEGPDIEMPLGADGSSESEDAESARDPEGDEKPGGLGQDGTIPDEPDGVAAGHTGEPSSFEPEEDEQSEV